MKNIWILGAGKFGQKAAKTICRKNPDAKLTVIEKNSATCSKIEGLGFKTVCMNGIEYLNRYLKGPDNPDLIIPAIPVHVAYEWVKIKLAEKNRLELIPVPDQLKMTLPNVFKGEEGGIYMSIADFICPDNCPEPEDICTYTGKSRPYTLYKRLESIQLDDFHSIVVRSRQLSPGIGGYSPRALFNALDAIKASNSPVLLSTACRCHGVMHAFRIAA